MERRDRSLKAFKDLKYIDSLDSDDFKAQRLKNWVETYLEKYSIEEFDYTINELKSLEELFFKNLKFLKEHREKMRVELDQTKKIRNFLK